jgi:hypothetical protein
MSRDRTEEVQVALMPVSWRRRHPADMSLLPATSPPPGDEMTPLAALRHRVDGDVLVPGDAGFADAAAAWNRTAAHDPAVIVVADNVGDVIATVTFAAGLGVGLGIQATGHGVVCPVDGVLLVTARLQDIAVDAEERTAWVAAGCTWGPVLAAAQAHGLAPLAGSSPTVGAVGYTLGGGLGWLARRYGPACDAVRSFEVVTPDGSLVRACRSEHAELFRALRGGGGSCGVVTDMEIELFPVTDVYAGNLYYPAEAASEVVERWASWVADAPDALTSSVVLMNLPPVPDVPEHLRGRSFTILRGCWSGPLDDGRALLDEWRATMPPVIDTWQAMPFADMAAISMDPVDPLAVVATGAWLETVDGDAGAILAAHTFPATGSPPLLFSEIRHLGGAVASGDRARSTMGNRDGEFLLQLVGVPMTPPDGVDVAAHEQATKAALGHHLSDRTYVNFLDGDERRRCAATAIDDADRAEIQELRRRLDPDDLLRFGIDHDA